MRTTSLTLPVLVVLPVVVAVNESWNLLRSSIETLKSIEKLPVCLRLADDSLTQLYPWISEMPVSCLVATSKCFKSRRGVRVCSPISIELFEDFDISNFVFLEPSWPLKLLTELNEYINKFYRVPILVILSSRQNVPRIANLCPFTWISDTTIDVPHENCIRDGGRKIAPRLSEDTFHAQGESLFPKNIALVISACGYDREDCNAHARYPEAVAYLNALPVLNVTPIFSDKLGHEDIILHPSTLIYTDIDITHDIGSVYTCISFGFFSSKVGSNPLNFISWSSLRVLLAGLIFIGAVIAASLCFIRRVFLHRPRRISDLLLFLVASSVGRSPVPLNVPCIHFQAQLLIWLFGTFIIGAYVQSQITSEYNVPAHSPSVKTIDDLERLISSGKILPCIDVGIGDSLLSYKESNSGIFATLTRVIERDFELCIADNEECYPRARENTHVYIASMDFAKGKAAREWELSPGQDILQTYCTVAPARRDFRYLLQHRRLVLALAEAGLTFYHERRRNWNDTKEVIITVTFPFMTQFQVLIYGCAGSCFIFLCEVVINKRMALKHAGAKFK